MRLVDMGVLKIIPITGMHPLLSYIGIQWVLCIHLPAGDNTKCVLTIEEFSFLLDMMRREEEIDAQQAETTKACFDVLRIMKVPETKQDLFDMCARYGSAERFGKLIFQMCDENHGHIVDIQAGRMIARVDSKTELFFQIIEMVERKSITLQDACDLMAQAKELPCNMRHVTQPLDHLLQEALEALQEMQMPRGYSRSPEGEA